MRRKDLTPNTGRGKSLVSIRTCQQQQRKLQMSRSMLPRSYSSPSYESECTSATSNKNYVMRSFSSPESKQLDYRKNSNSFCRPKSHGSRSELDSDLENFEQFESEDCFIDIDADHDDTVGQYRSSSERDEPKRVVTSLLPGSGLQRVSLRPITPITLQTFQNPRESMKKHQKDDSKGPSLLNFRPLVVTMPARHVITGTDPLSPSVEELQSSPKIEQETSELERELDNGEKHLEKDVSMATEESDADTQYTYTSPVSVQPPTRA